MPQRMSHILRWWRRAETAVQTPSNGDPDATPAAEPSDLGTDPAAEGAPATLHYPTTTLGRMLDQSAERFGDAPAMIYSGATWTYRQLLEQVNRLSGGLAHLGVRPGDRLLMTLPNCPEFVTCFLAAQKLGAVVVNAGPLMGADNLRRLIGMCEPSVLVALDLQSGALDAVGKPLESVSRLWVSLSGYQGMWKRLGYSYKLWQTGRLNGKGRQMRIEQLMAEAPARPPTVAPQPRDVAVLQPTGGTTGTLKVAELTHHNLLSNAMQMSAWARQIHGQDRILGILPMFHAYGLSTVLVSGVFAAATLLPLTRFRVDQVLETIRRHRPTVLPLVPAIIQAICESLEQRGRPDVCEALRGSLVISGAAALAPATAQWFEELTGAAVIQGYGLTEASPVTHVNERHDPRPGCIGYPLPDTEARIVDLHDPMREAGPGEAGELVVRGPQVFRGYFRDPEQTGRMLRRDGRGRLWLHTGDVARRDEDGRYYIVDRRKDMINRSGEKVWPANIERILLLHARVADAAVVGRPDAHGNEHVVAIVAPKGGAADAEQLTQELRSLCREHLGPHETPGEFAYVEQLPRTGLGKLQKHRLLDQIGASTGAAAEPWASDGWAGPDEADSEQEAST